MPRRSLLSMVLFALALVAPVLAARAQSDDDRYTIMRPEPGPRVETPEPWLPPTYRSPRGTVKRIQPLPKMPSPPPREATVPPPIVVPETGRALPNLPVISPSGPNGTETYQDRAARCAHQAGVYGDAAGNRNAYIGTCINQ